MRREPLQTEPLDAKAMRELLDTECPMPDGLMPPRFVEPAKYEAYMRAHAEARKARGRLLAEHGWTLLELLTAELDRRYETSDPR
jgi:hypothetical protein